MATSDGNDFADLVMSPNTKVDSNFTGIVCISGSAVNVTGPNVVCKNGFNLKGHPNNLNIVFYVNTGGFSASGFPLVAGESSAISASNLNFLDFGMLGSYVTSACVCWSKL